MAAGTLRAAAPLSDRGSRRPCSPRSRSRSTSTCCRRIAGAPLSSRRVTAPAAQSGIALYPISILLLLLVLPDRRDIVAARLGHSGVWRRHGDARGPSRRRPANPVEPGEVGAGTARLRRLRRRRRLVPRAGGVRPTVIPPAYPWFSLWMPIVATVAAAAVETIPIRLDDNVSVPATAAAVLWWFSLVSEDLIAAVAAGAPRVLPLAHRRQCGRRNCRICRSNGHDLGGGLRSAPRDHDRPERRMGRLGASACDVRCGRADLADRAGVKRRNSGSPKSAVGDAVQETRSRTPGSRPPRRRWRPSATRSDRR